MGLSDTISKPWIVPFVFVSDTKTPACDSRRAYRTPPSRSGSNSAVSIYAGGSYARDSAWIGDEYSRRPALSSRI